MSKFANSAQRGIALVEEIARLRSELARAAATDAEDALRYRWLRENSYIELLCDSPKSDLWHPQALDAAIDAARKVGL